MKQKRLMFGAGVAVAAFALMFSGCVHDEVDLENIDATANLQLGVGLPVGDLSFKINDFLGGVDNIVVLDGTDPADADNVDVLAFRDTFETNRNFHQIDVTQYTGNTATGGANYNLNPTAIALTLDNSTRVQKFDIEMDLSGINDNVQKERLDYVLVDSARFVVTINKTAGSGLVDSSVEKVELILDQDFKTNSGSSTYELPYAGLNKPMKCNIKDFYLYAMKDQNFGMDGKKHTRSEWDANAKQNLKMSIRFTLKNGTVINPGERLNCTVKVELIDYSNIFGWFEAGKQVCDSASYLLSQEWDEWDKIKDLELNLYNPHIKVNIKHQISGYLKVYCDYLGVSNPTEGSRYAYFNENGSKTRNEELDYLPIYRNGFGDNWSSTNVIFSNKSSEGQIDKLFEIQPDSIFYRYRLINDNVREDDNKEYQMQLGKNTEVYLTAMMTIPFNFKKGMNLNYTDTLKDIDIAEFALDSLIEENVSGDFIDSVSVKTADVRLVMTVENKIPLDVNLEYQFFDKNDNEIDFSDILTGDAQTAKNTLFVKAATRVGSSGGDADKFEQTKQRIIFKVDRDKLNSIADIDHIVYNAKVATNNESFNDSNLKVAIKKQSGMKISLGVSAQADADLLLSLDN